MGVKFKDILNVEKINLNDLNGRIIAIDAYNTLYQFLSGIRQHDGNLLMDSEGNITSHLSGILYRTSAIVEKGIKPIYVFDGKPSIFKESTVEKRRTVREDAEKKWKTALENGDEETARKYAIRSSRMSPYIIESSKKLMDLMGIPYVQSFGEGEAQAAYMVQNGDAWAVASQDYDCLLFGATKTIRNMTLSGGLSDLEYMELEKILNNLNLTREKLIDVALVVGTDFNEGIKGIGAKKGLKLVKDNKIEESLSILEKNIDMSIEELRNIFLKPEINKDYKIKWSNVNIQGLTEFLCEKHGFSESRVINTTEKMKNLNTTQKSLEDWF